MPPETTPLLFPEVLNANRLDELNSTHGLTQADLDWLHHTAQPSQTLRAAQTPAMSAEKILFKVEGNAPIPLAGCFTLSALPKADGPAIKPVFLCTPQAWNHKIRQPGSARKEDQRNAGAPCKRAKRPARQWAFIEYATEATVYGMG